MSITGQVIKITDDKVVSDKLTTKQVAVKWQRKVKDTYYETTTAFDLKDNGKYNTIKLLNGIKVGDTVEVQYNEPSSREYNGNFFTSVEAWSIKKADGNSQGASNDDSDDMPF